MVFTPCPRKASSMCTHNTESGCDCPCECGILLHDDRYLCPVHGIKALEAKAQAEQASREVSVARTRPLWEKPSDATGIDQIEQMVERAYYDATITRQQRSLFRWAVRKAREAESPTRCSRCARSIEVEEL
jgi:uncharacterized Zn finger protein (UPF0148 family)